MRKHDSLVNRLGCLQSMLELRFPGLPIVQHLDERLAHHSLNELPAMLVISVPWSFTRSDQLMTSPFLPDRRQCGMAMGNPADCVQSVKGRTNSDRDR